jgi:hypothetical protein
LAHTPASDRGLINCVLEQFAALSRLRVSPDAGIPRILRPVDGYLFLDNAKFRASVAANLGETKAAFLANS